MTATPIAYFTTRFPVRSETAVIKEMHELERLGYRVLVFSLKPSDFEGIHDPKANVFRERTVDLGVGLLGPALAGHLGRVVRLDGAWWGTLARTLLGGGRHLPKLLWLFFWAPALALRVRGWGARYLHANFGSYQAYAAWVVHRLTGIPFGFTVHAQDIFLNRFMMREKAREAALVASISEYNIRFLREADGVTGPQVRLLRCGVDLGEYPFSERSAAGDPLRVLAVGRLHEMKGFVHLVRACGLLQGKIAVRVEILGEGPEESQLRAAIRDLGLGDVVRIRSRVGHQELLEWYRTADVMVLPCQRAASGTMDGIPATLMEAMASGMPVITTSISGIPELVEGGATGLVVRPQDPAGIAAALQRLRADPTLVRRLSRQGRRRVEEAFDIRRNAGELARAIGEVIGGRPGAAT